jgi:predicted molibdopterin-dependent oxidoreductase YjgC
MDVQNIIKINGNEFSFEPGETILETARRNNIDIPTLCYLKGAAPNAKCGMCVVEVEGQDNLLKSCSTPATNSMVVRTESTQVVHSRRNTIRKLLALGNHNCAARCSDDGDWTVFQLNVQKDDKTDQLCPVWGDCRLQDLAYRYQVSATGIAGTSVQYHMEDINPFIVRDFSRCILCGRCVAACRGIQVNNAIDVGQDKLSDKIITPDDRPLKDSDCVFCGECVQACPVGALVEKDARYKVRQWETEKIRTTCSYCGVGCQLYLHVKDNTIVKVTGVEGAAPNFGSLCVKGRFGYHFVNSPERLTTPLIKENGKLREASWDEALDMAAGRLKSIKEKHGSDSIGVLTSARISNEENYIAHKFTRATLKTNNIDHCARL